MTYTLFSFSVESTATESLDSLFAQSQTRPVQIFYGAYVIETQKGWRNIHLLRSFLVNAKIPFVELPFEPALAGFFSPAIRDKLKAIGISDGALFNLSE